MLFNSYEFLVFFLPVALLVYRLLRSGGGGAQAIAWLVLCSLFFYGWWNPVYLGLIVASMAFNYVVGRGLDAARRDGALRRGRALLGLGIAANLAALGYFKYAMLLADSVNRVAGTHIDVGEIVLPLAISFFTFQQIAFLVDSHRGLRGDYGPLEYALFVCFFPQLIAGPIVHHREMMPQFAVATPAEERIENLSVGISMLAIGLFKKAVLADGIAPYAQGPFAAAAAGDTLTLFTAWGGALAYAFQIYFDFSGYSDMALGAARLFGIRLPLNFDSPYKATSIIDFWRRWHMTLSRFLRDYLYIPLGGSRKGTLWRYGNLMITMLLGGLWHGANWTFLVWGGLHGIYLVIAHLWRGSGLGRAGGDGRIGRAAGWLLTFAAVTVAWVFFRAADFPAAWRMLRGMAGLDGIALPNALAVRLGPAWEALQGLGVETYLGGGSNFVMTWLWIAALLAVSLTMPNTQEIMARFRPGVSEDDLRDRPSVAPRPAPPAPPASGGGVLTWRPDAAWAIAIGAVAALGVLSITGVSEFLYFQF